MKEAFKKIIKKVLYKRGYYIHRIGSIDFFLSLLEAFLRKNNEMFFIQIGANDGKSFDPIYQFVTNNSKNVRGILLEPLADYFEEEQSALRANLNR
jgi:lysophospholipase L1-like esterase